MQDRRIIRAARLVAASLVLGSGSFALAAPFASGVFSTGPGGNINYVLNENANVTIVRNGVASAPVAQTRGNIQVPSLGAATFSIVVTANSADGYNTVVGTTLANAPVRDGTLNGATLLISDDLNPRVAFNSPRAIAINNNPANGANFGRVYIANSAAGATSGFPLPFRALEDGIYINDAAGGDPTAQGDIARTAGINFTSGAASSPWRLALDADGNLYIGDWSDAFGQLYRTDQNVSTGTNLLVGQGAAGPTAPSATLNHGSVAAIAVTGSAAAGNLTVYTLDEDLSPTGTADKLNSLWRYNLGSTTANFSGNPDILASDLLIDNVPTGGIIVNLARSAAGNFYMTQSRTDGSEPGLFIVGNDGTTVLYNSLADTTALGFDGNSGVKGTQDILRTVQGVTISPDGKYMGIMFNNSNAAVVPLLDGTPDLANLVYLDTFDDVASVENIAFDAANNLYVVSSGNAGYRVFSPGGPSETTYNSDGTFRARTEPAFNGSGAYSAAGSWLLGVVPNAADAVANIGDISTGAQTLTVDTAVQLGRLRFSGGNYTVSGANTITMGAGFMEPRIIADAGNHTINAAVSFQKNVGLSAAAGSSLTLTNATYAAGITLNKFGGGRVNIPGAELTSARIRGGTLGLTSGVLKVTNLVFDNSGAGTPLGALDVGSRGVIIDEASANLATFEALVASGRAGGAWNGNGINSSAAAANPVTAVGIARAGDVGVTNFLGTPVTENDVIARFTRLGDANLDGTTNIGDFARLGQNFNQPGKWSTGDFNYDGTTNIGDFSLLASNFNQSVPAARPGAVPEPTGLVALGLMAGALVSRRRRA